MIQVESGQTFPLEHVKPLEQLAQYRSYCLKAARAALNDSSRPRRVSPVDAASLEPFGDVDGFSYGRCPAGGGIFLQTVSEAPRWARLLRQISEHRMTSGAFHAGIAKRRRENVYAPKVEWIENSLRLHELDRIHIMEVVTPPSALTSLLKSSGRIGEVRIVDEMDLAGRRVVDIEGDGAQAAVLLESLDRVDDPAALLRNVRLCLQDGGLIFVTAALFSGFDMSVLGLRNRYLYPPDRTNCFTGHGLEQLLLQAGFELVEFSTPGVLDVESVRAHLRMDPSLPLSPFERRILSAPAETQAAFQTFLQQTGMSSFARVVARKAR